MFLFQFFCKFSLSECENVVISNVKYCLYPNKTASVCGLNKNEKTTNLIIPKNIQHNQSQYEIISVKAKGFINTPLYGELVLPDSLLYIFDNSFRSTHITNVTFGENLLLIGYFAFFECAELTGHLSIPDKVTTIEETSFQATQITSLKLGASLTLIKENAFYECYNLTGELIIPDSVSEIGSHAFMFAPITSLKLGKGLKIIKSGAFNKCYNLTGHLTIPDSVDTVGIGAFAFTNITSLKIGSNLTKIDDLAFNKCSNLAGNLYIPNSVEIIGEKAFNYDPIISLQLGEKIKSIGFKAFGNCCNLTGALIIPNEVLKIGKEAFKLTRITSLMLGSKLEIIDDSAFDSCCNLQGKLILPPKLTFIGSNSFSKCDKLVGRLIIPSTVTYIGNNAFYACKGFAEVYFESNNVTVGSHAFADMHNKCFSNVPKSFKDSNQLIYSSDNFNGKILRGNSLNLDCKSFYLVDKVLVIVTPVVLSIAFICALFFLIKIIMQRNANIAKYTVAFKGIIKDCVESGSNNDGEMINNIVSKISCLLNSDELMENFTLTKNEANAALEKAFKESCPEMSDADKYEINKLAFHGIEFPNLVFNCKNCCNCCSKYRSINDDKSYDLPLINNGFNNNFA